MKGDKRYLNLRWNLPYKLSHVCIFGQTGSGKSQTIKSCVERAFLKGNTKIIDLYSGGAEEGSYYSLESNHPFWDGKEYVFNRKVTKKMSFPTNCLIPLSKNIPKNLPDIYTPFTIPLNTITENDLKSMLGGDLSKSEIILWRRVFNKIDKNTTLPDLLNYMIDAKSDDKKKDRIPGVSAHGISSVYNMFNGFEKERIFSSGIHPLALDMKEELKNKEVITSLILKYFPPQYWGFIINYFIHTIYDLVLQSKIKHNVVIVIREAGDFLEGITDSPQEEAVKRNIEHVVRKGRKHRLFFWIDNQTPLNMGYIRTEFPIKICHFVDNTESLKNSLGDLGTMLLNREDYGSIMSFKPGMCFVLTNTGLFKLQILPPLSRMSGSEGSNFFAIWRNERGSRFKNIIKEVGSINEEYKEGEKKWKDILFERKNRDMIKKQQAKIEKERIKLQLQEKRENKRILAKQEMEKRKYSREQDITTSL